MHIGCAAAAASRLLCKQLPLGELFELVLSKGGEPAANTKVDLLLSASIDRVKIYHLPEVCKKAALPRLYSKILWNCWVY